MAASGFEFRQRVRPARRAESGWRVLDGNFATVVEPRDH